jgi:pimeloyl-ACP methyl ester carboxylesterase
MKPQSRPYRKPSALLAATLWMAGTAVALEPADLAPPGSFVSLGTHRLYFDCRGQGSPRVLIDYGIAGAAVEWTGIQRELAADTTVCVYDRAGYGWSDPGPSPRTASRAAAEIEALAEAAGWREPLLLVGHSFGGFDVRYYAARRPEGVAGLVLLDSSVPGLSPVAAPGAQNAGIINPLAVGELPTGADDHFAVARYLNSRRKAVFAQMDELANFTRSADEVAAAGELPVIPAVVVSRDPAHGLADGARESEWQRAQRKLADRLSGAEWWRAEGSGHDIHRERPDLVVAAVRRVLARVRGGGGA